MFKHRLLAFTFLGMLPWQVTYFLAIQNSNAPTATVLQFTGFVFIILALMIIERRVPREVDVISVLFSTLGLILLVTNGPFRSFGFSFVGVILGLMTGVSSLLLVKLLNKYDSKLILGWLINW